MRIVFFGTPVFAATSLMALVENGFDVAGVVTATDKWLGRGRDKHWVETPVKQYAASHHIPVLQPEKLRDPTFLSDLALLQADIQVIVAFRMLPEVVWNMPPLGTVNVHASLLPRYRGAAPIHWAIIRGEKETGVTTFRLKHAIDTGDMLLQLKTDIKPDETAGDLHDRLMLLGADCLVQTLHLLEKNPDAGTPQPGNMVTHAPKLFHETCQIDFQQSTQLVYDFIRGLSPYPAAWTLYQNKILKIYKATKMGAIPGVAPGQIHITPPNTLCFGTHDGSIKVEELQLEGRKKMDTATFLRGASV